MSAGRPSPPDCRDRPDQPPEVVRSPAREADFHPALSVVITTYQRARFLGELMERLQSQGLSKDAFEVVLVDNGSADDTWATLSKLIASTALQATAISLSVNRGPGGGRNVGVTFARAPLLVFTDDDCLPAPGWLAGLLAGFESGGDIVQGRVAPDPDGMTNIGPWDHTIDIGCQTVWF